MTPSSARPPDDYEALAAALNARGVRYVIVGAFAVGYHGYIRATMDIDIFADCDADNAARLAAALHDFAGVKVDPKEIRPKTMIELGHEPNAVHILTSVTGLTWQEAWDTRLSGRIGAQPADFLSKEALVRNKRAVGRGKDLQDLKELGAAPRRGKKK